MPGPKQPSRSAASGYQRTRTGLREDQAAAALSVLTDGKRVSVINAPAGSGKTRVLTDASRAWAPAGLGPVVGSTESQSARKTLAAGVAVACGWPQEVRRFRVPMQLPETS
jgi:hypothetical protein